MFTSLGHLVVRYPWRVIAIWIAAAVILTAVAPSLKTTSDQASFLPADYESVKAQDLADRAFPESAGLAAVTVVKRRDGEPLTLADRKRVQSLASDLAAAKVAGVTQVSPPGQAVSKDGRVELVQVGFADDASNETIHDAVNGLRDRTEVTLQGSDLEAQMGGAPAEFADLDEASSDAEATVATATIALIVILLLAIFRSPVAALVPIITVAVVNATAMALIGLLADGFGLEADPSITSLLIVVLFGIGTDYTLFLLFRIRERLRAGDDSRQAVAYAVGHVGVTVASSAVVVIAAILALSLSELESNRALAPSLAIAVFVMLLASLTLVPAVLSLLGPRIFWPSRRWREERGDGLAARIAGYISRRPVVTLGVSSAVLIALAVVGLGFKSDYDTTGDLPSTSESAKAQTTLIAAFPQLTATPTSVLISGGTVAQVSELEAKLRRAPGVAGVSTPEESASGGVRRLEVYLDSNSAFANQALDTVDDEIRPIADSAGGQAGALVGGPTSSFVDVRTAITATTA